MAFSAKSEMKDGIGIITLSGELDASVAGTFRTAIEEVSSQQAKRLVLIMSDLTFMASAGLRMLVFAKQKMGPSVDIFVVGAHDAVLETIEMTGFHYSVIMLETYDAEQIEKM